MMMFLPAVRRSTCCNFLLNLNLSKFKRKAISVPKRSVSQIGHEKANDEVAQPLKGGQDQVGVSHVPLQGRGKTLETSNWECRAFLPLETQ